MLTPHRTGYIVGGAFKHFLGASILIMVSSQLAVTADAAIVGQFISSEALSGINALMPLICFMGALNVLLGTGTGIRISRLIGNRDYLGARRAFSAAIIAILVMGALVSTLLCLFKHDIVNVLCDDSAIAYYSLKYLDIYTFVPPLLLIGGFLCYFLEVDGFPRKSTRIILFSSIFNLIGDLVFIVTFGMDIEGSALATLLCYALQIILAWFGLRRSEISRMLLRGVHIFREMLSNMKDGLPLTVANLSLALLVVVLNNIIISSLGTVGMNIWSVCIQILMLAVMILNGVASAAVTIGSMLMGENDIAGVAKLHRLVVRIVGWSVGLLTIVMLLWPELVLKLFGADEQMMAYGAPDIIRIFSLVMLPFAALLIRQAFLMVLRYYTLSSLSSVGILVSIAMIIWLMSLFMPQYLWWGFPASLIIVNLLVMIVMFIMHLRRPGTSPLTLIPRGAQPGSWTGSVAFTPQAVDKAVESAERFLADNPSIDLGARLSAMQAIRGLADSILAHESANPRKKSPQRRRFDIHLHTRRHDCGELIITVKDDTRRHTPALDAPHTYKYMFGQNVVNITLPTGDAKDRPSDSESGAAVSGHNDNGAHASTDA